MVLNCGVGEYSRESLGQQGGQTGQSILKEISPEYSLEGLMLKLKLQYFVKYSSVHISSSSDVKN